MSDKMIKAIDHIELIVRDVDAHIELFEKLGFNVLTRTDHHGGAAELQLPGENQPIIEIHEVSGEEVIGINHIALRVDDAAEAYEKLSADGIPFTRGPKLIPVTGRTTVELRDPDGWRIQLVDKTRAAPESE
jgi:catechol 2,3-dioxygenase-like lactoylglutathione lyase family enzyme